MEQVHSSPYNHQSSRQVKACIKFVKQTMKKCFDTNVDENLAILQIWSIPIGPGLLSHAILLFNRPIWGVMPTISRVSMNFDTIKIQWKLLCLHYWKDKGRLVRIMIQRFYFYSYRADCSTSIGEQWNMDPGGHNHNDRPYKIHMTKTG